MASGAGIAPADFDAWLPPNTALAKLHAVLARASAKGLAAYRVSPRVNNVSNDDASLIEEAAV